MGLAFRCRRAWRLRCLSRWRIRCLNWCGAMRARMGRSRCARPRTDLRWTLRRSRMRCGNLRMRAACSRADFGPAACIASGATRRFCGRFAASRWPSCAAKWSRWSSTRWRASSRTGRGCSRRAALEPRIWTRCSMRSRACKARRCPHRCWNRRFCLRALPIITSAGLDTLIAAGEVAWAGVEPIGERDGRIALFLADKLPLLAQQRRSPIQC